MSSPQHIVCLIDDDDMYQFTAKLMLESTGMIKQIQSFYNGREALAYFNNGKNIDPSMLPDVIFLDINMPVMNGWEFLDEYHKLHATMPKPIVVYVVSSSVDRDDMVRSRSYEVVSDYLIKPVTRVRYQELMQGLRSA